jgi:hypothetical protein
MIGRLRRIPGEAAALFRASGLVQYVLCDLRMFLRHDLDHGQRGATSALGQARRNDRIRDMSTCSRTPAGLVHRDERRDVAEAD